MRIVIGHERLDEPDIAVALLLDKIRDVNDEIKQTYLTFSHDDIDYMDPEVRKNVAMHNKMVALFYLQRWDDALVYIIFLGGAFNSRLNNFYSSLIARIRYYKQNPPGEDWDGIYEHI